MLEAPGPHHQRQHPQLSIISRSSVHILSLSLCNRLKFAPTVFRSSQHSQFNSVFWGIFTPSLYLLSRQRRLQKTAQQTRAPLLPTNLRERAISKHTITIQPQGQPYHFPSVGPDHLSRSCLQRSKPPLKDLGATAETGAEAEDAEQLEATVVGEVVVTVPVVAVALVAVERAEEVEDNSSSTSSTSRRAHLRTTLPATASPPSGSNNSRKHKMTTTPRSASFVPTPFHITPLRLAAIRRAISAPCD